MRRSESAAGAKNRVDFRPFEKTDEVTGARLRRTGQITSSSEQIFSEFDFKTLVPDGLRSRFHSLSLHAARGCDHADACATLEAPRLMHRHAAFPLVGATIGAAGLVGPVNNATFCCS